MRRLNSTPVSVGPEKLELLPTVRAKTDSLIICLVGPKRLREISPPW